MAQTEEREDGSDRGERRWFGQKREKMVRTEEREDGSDRRERRWFGQRREKMVRTEEREDGSDRRETDIQTASLSITRLHIDTYMFCVTCHIHYI